MAYQALYRQWRPGGFDDLLGQEHVTRTLRNQMKARHFVHAYLFCGPRGTGKTSMARILAKAINCEQPVDGAPCGVCKTCVALSQENNMDITEIDAASNNGVEDIRDLREKIKYYPAAGRFKVYIIDEVHMLSAGAFNALLKTLEEPPAHAVLILATTEAHKLPATIISRCQRYDFHRIPSAVIQKRLLQICESQGVAAEEDALVYLARAAQGGLRDALSLLDQCLAFCGKSLTLKEALEVLGVVQGDMCFSLCEDIGSGNSTGAMEKVSKWVEQGGDTIVLAQTLMQHVRHLLLAQADKSLKSLADMTASEKQAYQKQASQIGAQRLLRTLERLLTLENDLKGSEQPRLMLEVALMRLCRPETEQSLEALQDRLEALEHQMAQGVTATPKAVKKEAEAAPAQTASYEKKEQAIPVPAVTSENDIWPKVMQRMKKEKINLYSAAQTAKSQESKGEDWVLYFEKSASIYMQVLLREESKAYVEQLLQEVSGKAYRLVCKEQADAPKAAPGAGLAEAAISLFGRDKVVVKE